VIAVAKHRPAKAESFSLPIAGNRIFLDAVAIKPHRSARPATPRLRFDKVALEFVDGLRSALQAEVPHGKTLVLSVTAPIRQSGKTATAFEDIIRKGLARRRARLDMRGTIEGNEVRCRLLSVPCAAKVIGFVHNPNIDGTVLLDAVETFLAALATAERKRAGSKAKGERWLVVMGEDGFAEAYRQICAAGPPATGFTKVLLVLDSGRVCEAPLHSASTISR
jgi:hypothetical protein